MATLSLSLLLGFLFLSLIIAMGAAYFDLEQAREEAAEEEPVALGDDASQADYVDLLAPVAPTQEEFAEYELLLKHHLEEEQAMAARFALEPSLESLHSSSSQAATNGGGERP